MRAYGTNCVHEYACEQRKLARPDIDAGPRLHRTRQGLIDQIDEAHSRGWLGEVEHLTHILAGVDDKLAEINRSKCRASLILVSPPTGRFAEPCQPGSDQPTDSS